MENRIIIKNSVMAAMVLLAVFLSQQPYFGSQVNDFTFPLLKRSSAFYDNSYTAKISDWIKSGIGQAGGGLEGAKSNLAIQADVQKNNIEKNSLVGAKKYVAQKFLDFLGVKPQDLQPSQRVSCQNVKSVK